MKPGKGVPTGAGDDSFKLGITRLIGKGRNRDQTHPTISITPVTGPQGDLRAFAGSLLVRWGFTVCRA